MRWYYKVEDKVIYDAPPKGLDEFYSHIQVWNNHGELMYDVRHIDDDSNLIMEEFTNQYDVEEWKEIKSLEELAKEMKK